MEIGRDPRAKPVNERILEEVIREINIFLCAEILTFVVLIEYVQRHERAVYGEKCIFGQFL